MYRMVFLDIDGTILDSQEQLDIKLIETIKDIQQKGILVGLATGRSFDGTLKYGELLGSSIYVTYNGGFAVSDGKIVHDEKIPATLAYQLCSETEKLGGAYIHFAYRASRSNRPAQGIEYLLPAAKISNLTETHQDAHRLVLYLDQHQRSMLQEKLTGAASFDEGDRLEVFPKGTKWTGILPVITHLGISPEEVVTIGNGTNDIGMLEAAGLGIAMGNAPECVKESADFVTEDNNHDGVILALNKVFNLHSSFIS
ncbi:HAD family hydrolase [Bacillus salipaludis]|uniref:HAD family hydrolase n=1 Tax=Bacillus salipaludis TaxID=2547811 RepID=UPI002E23BC50|nr:HAD family hydrolase [Bacillus salipaludis]